ncbi:MAG: D-aminoacylase [bacterium]
MFKKYYIFFLLIFLSLSCGLQPQYDLCIIDGKIVAGDGNPWYTADIGIKNEKIVYIGDISTTNAQKVIDAAGLYVCPGFIDIHNHSDRSIAKIPTADNYLLQGVTTVLGGNCGEHQYPVSEQFKKLKKSGIAINFCTLIGHNTIREEVMGLKMSAPSNEEMEKMKQLVEQEMKSGAMGFSTGLAYMPGRYAETEELIELASVVGRFGGMYASHIRNQGEHITESIEEAIEIGEKNNIRVEISHVKLCIEPNWGKPEVITSPVEQARERGVEVFTDQYPYNATSSGFSSSFPAWSLEGGNDQLKERLKNKESYEKIKQYIIEKRLTSQKGIDKLATIYIGNCEKQPDWEGKNLREILISQDKKPTISNGADLIIDIQKNGGASCVFFQMREKDTENLLKLDYNMVASDGSVKEYGKGVPHCRNYGSFPRVIRKYVKERKIFDLPEAVQKMSSLPAQVIRLNKRGLIKEDMFADLVVFDLKKIKDTATYKNPHNYPEGINYVIVNGVIAAVNGKATGILPGKVLYGPGRE